MSLKKENFGKEIFCQADSKTYILLYIFLHNNYNSKSVIFPWDQTASFSFPLTEYTNG